jgi:hypothetical protein
VALSDVHGGETALLKSNGGHLRLKTLEVGPGSVPILVVNDTANMERVGILCQPDPQFALDVAGPIRGEVLVGPHAIQLDGVRFLAHYDGHPTTYAGEFNAIGGGIGTTTGAYFLPGKFGKAAARTNIPYNAVPNPSFENGAHGDVIQTAEGWRTFQSGTGASWTYSSEVSHTGRLSARVKASSSGNTFLYNSYTPFTSAAYRTIYVSAWIYRTEATPGELVLRDDSNNVLATAAFDTSDGAELYQWEEVQLRYYTATALTCHVLFNNKGGDGVSVIFVDSVMATVTATSALPAAIYMDGNCLNATWDGAPNLSTSRMTAGSIDYNIAANLDTVSGTIMAWVKPYDTASVRWVQIVSASTPNTYLQLGTTSGSTIYARFSGVGGTSLCSGGTCPVAEWLHLALTYTPRLVSLYVNGVLAESYVPTEPFVLAGAPALQVLAAGAALIDDLVFTDRVLDANKVRSVYESNASVFATSSTFSFRATPKGLVWADENGFWVRNANGNDMFGVYGGEAAKYSWAEHELDPGDVFIGDGVNGYVWWQQDIPDQYPTLGPRLEIKGTLVGCDGSFSGSLSAATGTFSGSLTAARGNITGALLIGSAGGYIASLLGTAEYAGMTGGSLGTDTVLWAGTTYANRANAAFRVSGGGNLFANALSTNAIGAVSGNRIDVLQTSGASGLLVTPGTMQAGVFVAGNGSAAAPALTFAGNTNTGLHYASNVVYVDINGVAAWTFGRDATKGPYAGFGGGVLGGGLCTVAGFATTSAYLMAASTAGYASPGFEQTTAGAVVLRAPTGQVIDLRVNNIDVLTVEATQVALMQPIRNLRVNNDPGAQAAGVVAYTNVQVSTSSGAGTVKMWNTTAAQNVGWIRMWNGSQQLRFPVWAA